jgi:hypothetical protein
MSILSALKQHSGSIDELAALPQAMIMQMVQKKQINETMLAPILSRKAELAEATARTKAMQGGGQRPTVMEQLMAQNAQAEQPAMTDGRDMGIAQLPIEEPQYAGGGIVAFANNQDQPVDAEMRREGESENEYMRRVQAVRDIGAPLFNPRNYNPVAKLGDLYDMYQRNIGKPFAEGVQRFTSSDGTEQFRKAAAQKRDMGTPKEQVSTARAPVTPDSQYVEQDKNAYASTAVIPKEAGVKGLTDTKKAPTTPATKSPAEQIAPPMPETSALDKLIAEYTSQLKVSPEAAKSARADARNQALLEAGLNIMGGTSPYAFANIGAGGAAGAKSYGASMKDIRADEAAKLNQLMNMGLKGETLKLEAKKLGITEKHYQDWYKAKMAEIGESGATRRAATQVNDDVKREQLIINRQKAADAALAAQGYSLLAMSKKPEKQKQASDMKRDVYKQYGIDSVDAASPAGKAPAFNYVPGKGLVPVQ